VGILWSSFNCSHINILLRLLQYYLGRVIIISNLLPLIISITIVSFQLVSLAPDIAINQAAPSQISNRYNPISIDQLSQPGVYRRAQISSQGSRPSEFIYQGLWSRDSDNEAITIHNQSYMVVWHSNWRSKTTYLMGRHQIKIKPYFRHRAVRGPEKISGKTFA